MFPFALGATALAIYEVRTAYSNASSINAGVKHMFFEIHYFISEKQARPPIN